MPKGRQHVYENRTYKSSLILRWYAKHPFYRTVIPEMQAWSIRHTKSVHAGSVGMLTFNAWNNQCPEYLLNKVIKMNPTKPMPRFTCKNTLCKH